MTPEDSFADLLARLRHKDDDAAAKVFHRFTHRLVALARLHLDSRVRRKVDAEDVVMSVYKSFFVRQAAGEFDLNGWDGMWTLLTVITVRKCGRVRRHHNSAGRSAEIGGGLAGGDSDPGWQPLARDPSPEEAVLLGELIEGLLRNLNERDRSIVTLALQGYSPAEIVAETGTAERTVYRVLERMRAQVVWERYLGMLMDCARKRFDAVAGRAVEDEKTALSAFASFCRGVEQDRFPQRDNRNDLRNVLLLLVARKVRAERSGDKVSASADLPHEDADEEVLAQLVESKPTPEMAAKVADECRRLFDKLGDDELRTITLGQMEGAPVKEIAAKLGCAPRTVALKLAQIRDLWRAERLTP